jgi:hypothetical protein
VPNRFKSDLATTISSNPFCWSGGMRLGVELWPGRSR